MTNSYGQIIDIAEIPFLNPQGIDGRFLAGFIFYDGDWHAFLPINEPGKVVRTRAWPGESGYFGTSKEKESDFTTGFLNFMAQHANSPGILRNLSAIIDDIFNLSASLYKIDLIHRDDHEGASRLIATEIEYIFVSIRRVFDHIQEILRGLWELISLTDQGVKKRQLKKSFADMVLTAGTPRHPQELCEKFGLPPSIADFYSRQTPLFLKVREYRDRLVHGGKSVDIIFKGQSNFLIRKKWGTFDDINIWEDSEVEPNEIGPLNPVLNQLIYGILSACEDMAITLSSSIRFPEPMVPTMTFYLRGPFNSNLNSSLADSERRVDKGLSIFGKVTPQTNQ